MSKIDLAPEYKEAFSTFTSRPEYVKIIQFLNVQKNNIAVLEWFRIKPTDKNIAVKKARMDGNVEFINLFIRICKESIKGEDNG
jgi:hypothetical protein